jgi:hypothetical protein
MLAPSPLTEEDFPDPYCGRLIRIKNELVLAAPDDKLLKFCRYYGEALRWTDHGVDYGLLRDWFMDHAADLIKRIGAGNLDDYMERIEVEVLGPIEGSKKTDAPIRATQYEWTDPETIPPRDWLYGRFLIRKFVSATVSPGGLGKSSLIIAEILSKVSGKPLLGVEPKQPLKVWYWNLEDPQEEATRKIQAAAKHYGLGREDIGGRLWVDCGREQNLVIAKQARDGAMIVEPVVDSLGAHIIDNEIDVLIIDPFVSSHAVSENDNEAMDLIVKQWGRIADLGHCAVHLVHHVRKGEQEVTTESARGGKALTDGCRAVRVLNRMSKEEAEKAGVENHRLYFRAYNDKPNLAPPADKSDWYRLENVELGNGPLAGYGGDEVGVVTTWQWPDPLASGTGQDFEKAAAAIRGGRWKQSVQAKDWVGRAIGDALGLNVENKADRAKVLGILRAWLAAGSLVVVEGFDEKRREIKKYVEVAEE